MSAPLPGDWSELLHTSVIELQDAPALRSLQLDHVAEALAQPGAAGVQALPASVLQSSGQPDILLSQFSGRRLDEALDHAAAMQKITPDQVADWSLSQCIDEWAKSSAAAGAAPLPPAPGVLPSAVLAGGADAAAAHPPLPPQGMALPGAEMLPAFAFPKLPGAAFLQPLSGALVGGLPEAPEALPFLPGVALAADGGALGAPISEAARKEAAAAARAARVLKRREEKQRRLERQRKTSGGGGGGGAPAPPAADSLPPAPPLPLPLPQAILPPLPGVPAPVFVPPPVAVPVDAAKAPAAAAAPVAKPTADKAELRAIKNRESAARSRAKRVEYTEQLETKVNQLREQNRELRGRVIRAAVAPPDPHAGTVDGQTLRRTRTTPI